MLQLRDYQEEAVQAIYDYFGQAVGNPLIVVPTGGGKSLIIAEFIKRSIAAWPRTRVLVLTHVKELIEQNYNEFCGHLGDGIFSPAGIYSAGLGRRNTTDQILFAGVQSIYQRPSELGAFDLVLIDEAHLVPKKGMGRYRTYLDALQGINEHAKVVGFTATHFRLDGGYLHEGEGRIFTEVAYEVKLEDLVPEHLAPLVAKQPEHLIDVSGISTSSGDFKQDELEEASTRDTLVRDSVEEVVRIAEKHDRKAWLFFATTLRHAEMIAQEVKNHGVGVEEVFGGTPPKDRKKIVDDFRAGRLQALVNVGVLTTGFNAPRCDLMAVMRPTQSAALYVQIMGRGMRNFPGKKNCLVLDYGGNVARHGPINAVKPKVVQAGEKERTKVCMAQVGEDAQGEPELCMSIVPIAALQCDFCETLFTKPCERATCAKRVPLRTKTCPHCGYEFFRDHDVEASTAAPYDPNARKPRILEVRDMHFRPHQKKDKPVSLRVDYMCGMRVITEWVCLEHEGFARRKACKWWLKHGIPPVPKTVNEAIERVKLREIRMPLAIEVVDDGKYERVLNSTFSEKQEAT